MASTLQVDQTNFQQEVLESPVPVLVDFWAEWCSPCKMLLPVLEELARDKAGVAKVVKINVDDNEELAAQYGIQSIPALFFFKNGQLVHKQFGVTPKSQLSAKLDQLA